MKRNPVPHLMILIAGILIAGCAALSGGSGKATSLLFSVEDDKKLGKQVSEEIASKPSEFPVLPAAQNRAAYNYLNNLKDQILSSGNVAYDDEFVWELKIIDDDKVLNAFATPGGYIYVYTGLIKYLDRADDLAGVLGHEIAHADRRHSVKQLEKQYGVSILLSIALGQDPSQLAQIVAQLAGTGAVLKFSRSDESEADAYSVEYLADTRYACNGAASFFQKLEEEGKSGRIPEFLSTHPSPSGRIRDINEKAQSIGCSTAPIRESGMTYAEFKQSL